MSSQRTIHGTIPPGEDAPAPELRRDPVSGRVVLIAPERGRRPGSFLTKAERAFPADDPADCPFCPGHEDRTPPEISAVRPAGSPPDGPGWRVRVIPNKFPALAPAHRAPTAPSQEGPGTAPELGFGSRRFGAGAHEVVIESPRHDLETIDLPDDEAFLAWAAVRDRIRALEAGGAHAYIQVFKNRGREAGASLRHPHTQIAALPFVPPRAAEELALFAEHASREGECLLCRHLADEIGAGERMVLRSGRFAVWAPFGSSFPFELRLAPLEHAPSFASLADADGADFAACLRLVLGRLRSRLDDPDFNLVLQQAPVGRAPGQVFHWRLDILPMLIRTAGFEWGTGIHINPVAPEEAAAALRFDPACSGPPPQRQ